MDVPTERRGRKQRLCSYVQWLASRALFSVAVEGLALRACTLRSPGRKAPLSCTPGTSATCQRSTRESTKREDDGREGAISGRSARKATGVSPSGFARTGVFAEDFPDIAGTPQQEIQEMQEIQERPCGRRRNRGMWTAATPLAQRHRPSRACARSVFCSLFSVL